MPIISEELLEKIKEKVYLAEKSFFDLDKGADVSNGEDNADVKSDDENKTTNESDESTFTLQHKLQLKLLFNSMRNIMNLSKYLMTVDKEHFEPVYENYNRLYNYFKDYVMNFDDIEDSKKVKLLKLFREAFKAINKKFVQTIENY